MDPQAIFVVMWQEVLWVGSSWTAVAWSSTAAPLGKAGTTTTNNGTRLISESHNKSCNVDRWYWNELGGKLYTMLCYALQIKCKALLLSFMLCLRNKNTTPSALSQMLPHGTRTGFLLERLTDYQFMWDWEVTLGNDSVQTIQKESIVLAATMNKTHKCIHLSFMRWHGRSYQNDFSPF